MGGAAFQLLQLLLQVPAISPLPLENVLGDLSTTRRGLIFNTPSFQERVTQLIWRGPLGPAQRTLVSGGSSFDKGSSVDAQAPKLQNRDERSPGTPNVASSTSLSRSFEYRYKVKGVQQSSWAMCLEGQLGID